MFAKLLRNRKINAAFRAIDGEDVSKLASLLDGGLDPNSKRFAVLEGYTFKWEEFLLTRAVRNDKYTAALLLLDRGANPHVHDELSSGLEADLYLRVDRSGLLKKDPVEDVAYQDHPLLSALVVLEWQRPRHQPMAGLGPIRPVLDVRGANVDTNRIDRWLATALPLYAAEQLKKDIGAAVGSDAGAPARPSKM